MSRLVTHSFHKRTQRGLFALLLQPVAQGILVAALASTPLALALARLDQVFEASRPIRCGFATLGATPVSLHPQLILPLAGDLEMREFV